MKNFEIGRICISNSKLEILDWTARTMLSLPVHSEISTFDFEMQDSSNFKSFQAPHQLPDSVVAVILRRGGSDETVHFIRRNARSSGFFRVRPNRESGAPEGTNAGSFGGFNAGGIARSYRSFDALHGCRGCPCCR